jgi:hypothetical protein
VTRRPDGGRNPGDHRNVTLRAAPPATMALGLYLGLQSRLSKLYDRSRETRVLAYGPGPEAVRELRCAT